MAARRRRPRAAAAKAPARPESTRSPAKVAWAGAFVCLLAAATACTSGDNASDLAGDEDQQLAAGEAAVRLLPLDAPAIVVTAEDAAGLALATTQALVDAAPVAALAPADDAAAIAEATAAAAELGVPLLLVPAAAPTTGASRPAPAKGAAAAEPAPLPDVGADPSVPAEAVVGELDRLGTAAVITFGSATSVDLGDGVTVFDGSTGRDEVARLRPTAAEGVVALVDSDDPLAEVVLPTLHAAGIPTVTVDAGDPRVAEQSRTELAGLQPTQVVAVGGSGRFPSPETLAGLVATAAAGTELPGGGQVLFPERRLVALYGHPGTSALGVMGEQPVDAAVDRAAEFAAPYAEGSDIPVVPTFEMIATVASAEAGADGDYSSESAIDHLRPWVDAAGEAGMYVVLDLQPGYTDFLTQAKLYEELLREPHVGLALDPEWRLAPGQRHMQVIGSVHADEINETIAWLSELTRTHALPQKLLVVHQFRLSMVQARDQIATPPEVAVLFQMDGDGSQGQKLETWGALLADPTPGTWFGWKNFIDEDEPMRSPADTAALDPTPLYISYQ